MVTHVLAHKHTHAHSPPHMRTQSRSGTSKDADMSPFECARRLLDPAYTPNPSKPGGMTTGGRLDLYFADSDLVPLLVQENYLNHKPVVARGWGVGRAWACVLGEHVREHVLLCR